jgi:hypothetical protein
MLYSFADTDGFIIQHQTGWGVALVNNNGGKQQGCSYRPTAAQTYGQGAAQFEKPVETFEVEERVSKLSFGMRRVATSMWFRYG